MRYDRAQLLPVWIGDPQHNTGCIEHSRGAREDGGERLGVDYPGKIGTERGDAGKIDLWRRRGRADSRWWRRCHPSPRLYEELRAWLPGTVGSSPPRELRAWDGCPFGTYSRRRPALFSRHAGIRL